MSIQTYIPTKYNVYNNKKWHGKYNNFNDTIKSQIVINFSDTVKSKIVIRCVCKIIFGVDVYKKMKVLWIYINIQ